MTALSVLRKRIDNIDEAIIKKLAERKKLSIQIGQMKAMSGLQVKNEERETLLFEKYEHLSDQYGLSRPDIIAIFKRIISYCRSIQKIV